MTKQLRLGLLQSSTYPGEDVDVGNHIDNIDSKWIKGGIPMDEVKIRIAALRPRVTGPSRAPSEIDCADGVK